MSHFKAKMHQIRFPASVRSFVRLLDGVSHLATSTLGASSVYGARKPPAKCTVFFVLAMSRAVDKLTWLMRRVFTLNLECVCLVIVIILTILFFVVLLFKKICLKYCVFSHRSTRSYSHVAAVTMTSHSDCSPAPVHLDNYYC